VGIAVEQREKLNLVCLDGAVDIASAAELKTSLIQALEPGHALSIALDRCTHLDVTAVQLLWAAERKAKALGVEFTLAGAVPEPVSATLREAGFENLTIHV